MRAWSALFLLAFALPAGGRAEVLDAAPSGFTVQNVAEVPVDAGAAWRALVDDVAAWWPRDHTWWGEAGTLAIDPRPGGCFCERGPDGRGAAHLRVVFVDPGRLLRLEGGLGPLQGMGLQGALEFRFEPLPAGGTRITLWYRAGGYTPDDLSGFAAVVDRVQGLQLGGLAAHLRDGAAPAREEER